MAPLFTTYYTGHESAKLKALSAQNNGGGFMFWEMGHDANNDNALLKVACDAIGKLINRVMLFVQNIVIYSQANIGTA
ncbi:hypothetical protein LWM68_46880 [Niabella sp. W65]|nr:hypothetical protein [Niabella sp. W65]MCH7369595.1 hypothetical protein [Niabella sp. W65]